MLWFAAPVASSAATTPTASGEGMVLLQPSTPRDAALLTPPARRDYEAWLALGPGGLPANVGGWLTATLLRSFSREPFSVGVYGTAPAPAGPLMLEPRRGPRPVMAPWPVPHRQQTDVPSAAMREATVRLPAELVADEPRALRLATSKFERHGSAVFVLSPGARAPWVRGSRNEAVHVHPSDGSLHVVLHPADARVVIDAGWGQRHPLSGVPLLGLPVSYLSIYAPRTDAELEIVRTIARRATGGPGSRPAAGA